MVLPFDFASETHSSAVCRAAAMFDAKLITRSKPAPANSYEMPRPIPREAPVMSSTEFTSGGYEEQGEDGRWKMEQWRIEWGGNLTNRIEGRIFNHPPTERIYMKPISILFFALFALMARAQYPADESLQAKGGWHPFETDPLVRQEKPNE